MVNQHESPFYPEDAAACQRAHKRIVESFPISRVYQAHIPTYPFRPLAFSAASKSTIRCTTWMRQNGACWGSDALLYTGLRHRGRLPCRLM